MRKLLLGIGLLLIPFSLIAVNETGTSAGLDPCKSANPVPGCPRIVIQPRPLNPVRPDYATDGKRRQGLVRIGTTIASDGEVKDIQVLSGDDELKRIALAAVRQWHYRPSSVNGIPVEVHHEIAISFTKKDGALLGADDVPADLPMEPPEDWYQLLRTQALQRVGGTVKPPRTISVRDPEYSGLAKRNRYEGVCLLSLIVS
jgi:TonB family protein